MGYFKKAEPRLVRHAALRGEPPSIGVFLLTHQRDVNVCLLCEQAGGSILKHCPLTKMTLSSPSIFDREQID